jgi:hypothetical protein
METLKVETNDEAVDMLNMAHSATELRSIASDAGVSRQRGDTKRQTAKRIVLQEPQEATRIMQGMDEGNPLDPRPFMQNREVGAEHISLEEAMRRAKHKKMMYKLKELKQLMPALPNYEAKVKWEYDNSTLTSVMISRRQDAPSTHWSLKGRAQILLSQHGGLRGFQVDGKEMLDEYSAKRAWSLGLSRIENFYDE